ncbi:MAG: choice-of-anchor Q domain-containing protein, partial [Chloroflexota bacterium]
MDNKRIVRRMGVGLALSLLTLGLLGARPAAQANTTLTVNSTLDAVDANPGDGVCATAAGACTLRAAVQEANALVGMDTIIVPAGTYDLSILGSGEDATATGDLDILDDLTITGDGANLVTLDGSRLVDRVLHVLGSTEVTLSGVTVAGGTADTGGGIYTIGSLTLVNTHLIANFSTDAEITGGGAIYNEGDLLLQRSTISGNSAADRGGGIYTNGSSATVTLVNSTITGNTASYGGGIASFGREVTTFSSTISHNSATNFGGGIYLDVKTSNTIWADNTANRDGPNCSGFLDSSGYNLVSNNSGCSIESTTGDQIGTAAHPIDPLLGALQNNGGQTPTQALLPGSPAIEAGDAAGCLDSEGFLLGIDQRNYDRRADGDGDGWRVCDIGAYEFGAASEPDFSLVAAPAAEDICKAGTANFSIGLQSYAGFANPVTLSVSGQPAGSTVTFSINPITPPGSSTLTVNAPDPTPGMYPMIVDGTSFGSLLGGYVTTQTITHTTSITLNVYSDAPGTVTLTTPADGATGVPLRPAFAWQANQEASAYDLEIALDEDFTNVVYRATTSTPNHTSATMLTPATTYYWRVRPQNACGDGSFSTVYSFTTLTPATQFLVNSTVDVVDAAPGDGLCATAGGVCTLRAAVQETNALPGANTISLPRGTYQLTIRGSDEDEAATGDLDIRDRLKLVGPNSTRTMIRGMNSDRILQVHGQQTVSVVGLTITGGAAENGAGIYNEGTLTLNRSSLTANGAADRGGGLYNVAGAASATIRNSTIADNSAGHGGGVFHFGTTLTIDGSTISGNTASVQGATLYLGGGAVTVENSTFTGNGGGIENFGELTVSHSTFSGNVGAISNSGVLTVSYSTIADNTATGISNDGYGVAYINYSTISNNTGTGGGGIYNGSTLYVNNSTISGNEAVGSWGGGGGGINTDAGVVIITNSTIVDNTTDTFGGGIYASGFKYNPLVSLHHTILANNSASWGPDCWPAIGSLGYNIIGDTQDCLFGAQYGDQTNVDPRIGPLRDNGGPTLTHALQANSPAVDAGDPAGCADPYGNLLTDDQRGFLRPVDGDGNGSALCDTGAYERGSTAPPDFTLAATPAVAEVCAPANTLYDVQLNAIGGYADPVTL